jgi:hypothetical protein
MAPVTSQNEIRTRLSSIQRANQHGPPGSNVPFPVVRVQSHNERPKRSHTGNISVVQDLLWVGATSGGIMGFNVGLLWTSFTGMSLLALVPPGVACMVGIAIGASTVRQFCAKQTCDLCVILRT